MKAERLKEMWEGIYRDYFGMDVDFSNLEIPEEYIEEYQGRSDYMVVIVAQGITAEEVVDGLSNLFNVNVRQDGVLNVPDGEGAAYHSNVREADEDYVVVFENSQVFDQSRVGAEVFHLENEGYHGITLLERLLLEALFYLNNDSTHLDDHEHIFGHTLCHGSGLRYNKDVPTVGPDRIGGGGIEINSVSRYGDNYYAPRRVIYCSLWDNGSDDNEEVEDDPIRQVLNAWEEIYSEHFGMDVDFSDLNVPDEYDPRKHVLIVMEQGLTLKRTLSALRRLCTVEIEIENSGGDFSSTAKLCVSQEIYETSCSVVEKSNFPTVNLSKRSFVNWLDNDDDKGIKLIERLLMELYYRHQGFDKLDFGFATICAKPYTDDGFLLAVDRPRDSDSIYICKCDPFDNQRDNVRTREVLFSDENRSYC